MKDNEIEALEKRVAELEKGMAELLQSRTPVAGWKDWRLAVGTVNRTELAEEVDAAAREIREADRRETSL